MRDVAHNIALITGSGHRIERGVARELGRSSAVIVITQRNIEKEKGAVRIQGGG
jgi:NAD(P)-dependent dehydrogenase (short-subunit alcohol dehydrogenase family)